MVNEKMYNELCWVWPIISPPEDYVEESAQFHKLIRKYSRIEPKTLLDLGCGGGHISHALTKYFDVTGVDLSESMLALSKELNPNMKHFQGDMRYIRLDQQFDTVIAADAICYMLSEDDMLAAFKTAFEHLNSGGVFLTYAEITKESFIQNEVSYSLHKKGDIEITFIENNFDPDRSDSTYEYTAIYLIRKQGKLDIQTDTHTAGIFSLKTWKKLLEKVGFQVEQMTLYGEREDENYPFFICLKRRDGSTVSQQ